MTILRDALGHYLPGQPSPNPSGRPSTNVSLVKLLADRLANEPKTAAAIISAWISACKAQDMPAIKEALDRIDGKVPSEVNVKALMIHVGDDYARAGLEAIRQQLEEGKDAIQE